eukprot:gene584-9615_t
MGVGQPAARRRRRSPGSSRARRARRCRDDRALRRALDKVVMEGVPSGDGHHPLCSASLPPPPSPPPASDSGGGGDSGGAGICGASGDADAARWRERLRCVASRAGLRHEWWMG